MLLLGDPGTAKSQLLKFVENCSPIGVSSCHLEIGHVFDLIRRSWTDLCNNVTLLSRFVVVMIEIQMQCCVLKWLGWLQSQWIVSILSSKHAMKYQTQHVK